MAKAATTTDRNLMPATKKEIEDWAKLAAVETLVVYAVARLENFLRLSLDQSERDHEAIA